MSHRDGVRREPPRSHHDPHWASGRAAWFWADDHLRTVTVAVSGPPGGGVTRPSGPGRTVSGPTGLTARDVVHPSEPWHACGNATRQSPLNPSAAWQCAVWRTVKLHCGAGGIVPPGRARPGPMVTVRDPVTLGPEFRANRHCYYFYYYDDKLLHPDAGPGLRIAGLHMAEGCDKSGAARARLIDRQNPTRNCVTEPL